MVINDLMALGVLKGLRQMGLRVPGDMALVGCDNQFFSDYIDPALTTLDLNADMLGELAMRKLLYNGYADETRAAPDLYNETTVLQPRLIIRESCGANARRETDRVTLAEEVSA
jgi:DNA-binding LacI/PurR family transcriptional regulator